MTALAYHDRASASAGHVLQQNDTSEQMILSFGEVLPQPAAVVELNFSYSLRPGLEGLYRSQFTGEPACCYALLSCTRVST